uniref:Uncharacterized protein n=1 Tax=Ditylenchus dipsaci TaxID=166011 RepID=A0A915EIR4_9BILA
MLAVFTCFAIWLLALIVGDVPVPADFRYPEIQDAYRRRQLLVLPDRVHYIAQQLRLLFRWGIDALGTIIDSSTLELAGEHKLLFSTKEYLSASPTVSCSRIKNSSEIPPNSSWFTTKSPVGVPSDA